MGRCKLEHGLVFWPEPLVKSNGEKRLKRQAMPKCQQPPHTDTPGSESVLVCIGDICIRICMLMLPLYKQNKQMSKYTRIGDCSTNLLLLLGIHATEVSIGYVCYCSDCFVLLLLLLLWKHLAWRYFDSYRSFQHWAPRSRLSSTPSEWTSYAVYRAWSSSRIP